MCMYMSHVALLLYSIVAVCAEKLDEVSTGRKTHPGKWKAGLATPMEAEAAECRGWLNGTRDTYNDPAMLKARIRAWSGGFTSQHRQDTVLFKHLFRSLKRPGIYADVAANHYKRISNTYFYDRCLNWRGVCVEPNPVYHDDLREKRTCNLVPTCVSNASATLDFHMTDDAINGVYGSVDKGAQHGKEGKLHRLHCVTLGSVFADLGMTHVDFLSLDVEKHEEAVLRGIDFSRVQIDYIVCESWSPQCANVLPQLGYSKIVMPSALRGDDYWRSNTVQLTAAINTPNTDTGATTAGARTQRAPQLFDRSHMHVRS